MSSLSHPVLSICSAMVLTAGAISVQGAVVTTADNGSPAGDGKLSLREALEQVQDHETISFNIPGEGPHYLVTPTGGYPLIEKTGITIDGYTQPGASPNTAAPDTPRDTRLKIVLDSRTDQPNERRTILDFPGFGLSESCVLGFRDAPDARVRGLAFIGVSGSDGDTDAYVYCIALAGQSTGARVQGCWFGLDPARPDWRPRPDGVVPGVYGARAAIASFKWSGASSSGLIFGVDGDGTGDRGEGNVSMGQLLAVHLETPDAVVAGNWINFFPDGSLLNPERQQLPLHDNTLEAIENGDAAGMRIGTNGDGVSDAEEGNRFGPVIYSTFIEFWRTFSPAAVIAGNRFGTTLDGLPAFASPGIHFCEIRSGSGVRIGAAGTTAAGSALAAHEANHLYGIGSPLLKMTGASQVTFRGNVLTGNTGGLPLDSAAGVTPEAQFALVLQDPFNTTVTLDSSSTPTSLSGAVPVQLSGAEPPLLDVFLADPFGLYEGYPQGRKWLATYPVDTGADQNPIEGEFRFDITALGLTAADLGRVTVSASYPLADGGGGPPQLITTNFSDPLEQAVRPPDLGGVTITPSGTGFLLEWTGGTPPFQISSSASLAGPWIPLKTVSTWSTTLAPEPSSTKPREFYRVREGALP